MQIRYTPVDDLKKDIVIWSHNDIGLVEIVLRDGTVIGIEEENDLHTGPVLHIHSPASRLAIQPRAANALWINYVNEPMATANKKREKKK